MFNNTLMRESSDLEKNIFGVFASIFCSIPAMADSFTLQLLHLADIDSNEQSALSSVDECVALVGAFKADPVYGPNTLFVSSGENILVIAQSGLGW